MAQELISTPHSYHDLLSRLDDIRQEYQRLGQSYRSSLYQLMAHSMGIALEIESDEQGKDQFLKSVGQKSDVVYAAMIFISDAKTEGARKKASKAARALRYLVEHIGVSLDNIPEGIREHGGIEELARLAAQDKPSFTTNSIRSPMRAACVCCTATPSRSCGRSAAKRT
jgi:hypothetical protein